MMQNELSLLFKVGERARSNKLPADGRWGSHRNGGKDSLWDSSRNIQWQRDHPDGKWEVAPIIGSYLRA